MGAVRAPRWIRFAVVVVMIAAVLVGIGSWPVTTAVGYNYHVIVKRLTLFEKAIWFVDRDLQMHRLAREIAGEGGTPESRLLHMYEWVADNIHPAPPGFPIVDDHVTNIFVRHYGADDQRAEALAALATYDGMPASTLGLAKAPKMHGVQLTVVQLGDRLVAFDVNHRIVFRTSSGELATLDDLKNDPSLVSRAAAGRFVDGVPYHEHFQRLGEMTPKFLRMEDQRLLPRLKHELLNHLPHG